MPEEEKNASPDNSQSPKIETKDGKWFLEYTWYNDFERAAEQVKIPLVALTEEQAKQEAEKKWAQLSEAAKIRFEEQKRTWVHPPKSPFEDGPSSPRIIYEIRLEIEQTLK